MTLLQAIFLGIIQGITEFLPISSSGHLILVESFLKLDVHTLKDFDIILHVGTLAAILVYFWRDFLNHKLYPFLILGSVPAAIVGLTLEDSIDAVFRNADSVAAMILIVGCLFLLPEPKKTGKPLTFWRALAMGLAQAVAIIPGVSRSGLTIWTGTLFGLKREEAARFSFLLGAIAIAGAGLLTALDSQEIQIAPNLLLAGFLSTFFTGLVVVSAFMALLKKFSLKMFGVYRIVLGLIVLFFF